MASRGIIGRILPFSIFFTAVGIGVWLVSSSDWRFRSSSLETVASLFLPIQFAPAEVLLSKATETFLVAVAGTFLGFALALGFSLVVIWLRAAPRLLLSVPAWFARGVPDVVLAVLLAQILGFGPLTGLLALALGTFGVSTRLILNSLLARDLKLDRAFELSGMGRGWLTISVIIPANFRDLVSQFLLRLEVNFRIAVVLGLVGGGGLGLLLSQSLGLLDYQRALGTAFVIALFVFLTESFSGFLRKRRMRGDRSILSSMELNLGPMLLLFATMGVVGFAIGSEAQRFSIVQLERVAAALVSPDFVSQSDPLLLGLLQSVGLAALAASIAFPIAIAMALLSTPKTSDSKVLAAAVRAVLGVLRSVPIAVLAVVLVVPLGLGVQTALLALVLGGSLFVARIIADSLDDDSQGQVDVFMRSGAGFLVRGSVLLLTNRSRLRGNWFFTLDFLFRYSVILGILGAGGLGQVILSAIRVQDIRTVAAAVLLIVAVVGALELAQSKTESRDRLEEMQKAKP